MSAGPRGGIEPVPVPVRCSPCKGRGPSPEVRPVTVAAELCSDMFTSCVLTRADPGSRGAPTRRLRSGHRTRFLIVPV